MAGGGGAGDEASSRELVDPWEGVVDTFRIRHALGFCPVYPSV